jgi:dolichyl-diphosphooligosaccharide--protein glycosyltransferase
MVRLILLTGPIASVLGGISAGRICVWCIRQWWESQKPSDGVSSSGSTADEAATNGKTSASSKSAKKAKSGKKTPSQGSSFDGLVTINEITSSVLSTQEGLMFKRMVALLGLFMGYMVGHSFVRYAFRLAVDLSHPSIIIKGRSKDNQVVKIDDYREAYWWLRDNTPEDARIGGT